MKERNITGLREALENLPTNELDAMLQAELEKSPPDEASVRLMLSILEGREPETPPAISPDEAAAWERYQKRMAGQGKKPATLRRRLAVAASVAVIAGLLFAVVPQQAEAETFWEMLQRWTETVMEYFSKQDSFRDPEYIFKTDNAGLQQVYDAVVELGVTDPVVPMWLPEGYEIVELDTPSTPLVQSVFSRFFYNGNNIVFKLDIYVGEPAHQFYRDGSYYEEYEKNGMSFYITQNNGSWVAVWVKDNIECLLTVDCQEDTLRRILRSIYVMED